MDLSSDIKQKLARKSTESSAGGGYTNLRFVLKDAVDYAPLPIKTGGHAAEVFDSFTFLGNNDFVPVSANVKEFDFSEEANEEDGSGAMTSTVEGLLDGDEITLRNLVNGYDLNAQEVFVLIDHCKKGRTYLFGAGKCCPAKMKISFKGGKERTDMVGFPVKITVEDDGFVPVYRGVGAMSRQISMNADLTALDVSTGAGTYLLPENTKATEITALNNALSDQVYNLKWNSETQHSTIADGSTFHLRAAFTPKKGAILQLKCLKAGEFVEIGRYIPA